MSSGTTEPQDVVDTRTSYAAFAAEYTEHVRHELDRFPLARALLSHFAELVQANGGGPVADLGCGPGRVAAHLARLGLDVLGIDLTPAMVEIARREHPSLRFEVGTMAALDLPDDGLAGALAWYSIIHTPPARLPVVFAELHRVLAPGGHLLLAFQVGDQPVRPTEMAGHPVTLTFHRHQVDAVADLALGAGLEVVARTRQERQEGELTPQGFVLARKPVGPGGDRAP